MMPAKAAHSEPRSLPTPCAALVPRDLRVEHTSV